MTPKTPKQILDEVPKIFSYLNIDGQLIPPSESEMSWFRDALTGLLMHAKERLPKPDGVGENYNAGIMACHEALDTLIGEINENHSCDITTYVCSQGLCKCVCHASIRGVNEK